MADNPNTVKVGSRKSQLALIQTHTVIAQLKKTLPEINFEVVSMTTTGDNILDTALSKIGEKSLFTKELENALLEKSVAFVVHSLKDLPSILPEGLVIGAVCKRDDPHDALVLHPKHAGTTLEALAPGSVIGTSSLRRAAQFKKKYPHLVIKDVRGNLNTRLRKLDEAEDYDALVLAVAGMERMGWSDRVSQVLDPSVCMYAVSQGAMAVECRADDRATLGMLSRLHHRDTLLQCVAERGFLRRLEGGCSVPVAVHSVVTDKTVTLKGGVYSLSGAEGVEESMTCDLPPPAAANPGSKSQRPNGPRMFSSIVAEAECQVALQAAADLGLRLAETMIAAGAGAILDVAKQQTASEIKEQQAAKEEARRAGSDSNKTLANGAVA